MDVLKSCDFSSGGVPVIKIGDKIILHHNSSYELKEGLIKKGKPNGNGILNKNGFEYNGIWSSENENVKCNGVVKNKNKEIIFEGKFKINE